MIFDASQSFSQFLLSGSQSIDPSVWLSLSKKKVCIFPGICVDFIGFSKQSKVIASGLWISINFCWDLYSWIFTTGYELLYEAISRKSSKLSCSKIAWSTVFAGIRMGKPLDFLSQRRESLKLLRLHTWEPRERIRSAVSSALPQFSLKKKGKTKAPGQPSEIPVFVTYPECQLSCNTKSSWRAFS